jgi:hypothetical protein
MRGKPSEIGMRVVAADNAIRRDRMAASLDTLGVMANIQPGGS